MERVDLDPFYGNRDSRLMMHLTSPSAWSSPTLMDETKTMKKHILYCFNPFVCILPRINSGIHFPVYSLPQTNNQIWFISFSLLNVNSENNLNTCFILPYSMNAFFLMVICLEIKYFVLKF